MRCNYRTILVTQVLLFSFISSNKAGAKETPPLNEAPSKHSKYIHTKPKVKKKGFNIVPWEEVNAKHQKKELSPKKRQGRFPNNINGETIIQGQQNSKPVVAERGYKFKPVEKIYANEKRAKSKKKNLHLPFKQTKKVQIMPDKKTKAPNTDSASRNDFKEEKSRPRVDSINGGVGAVGSSSLLSDINQRTEESIVSTTNEEMQEPPNQEGEETTDWLYKEFIKWMSPAACLVNSECHFFADDSGGVEKKQKLIPRSVHLDILNKYSLLQRGLDDRVLKIFDSMVLINERMGFSLGAIDGRYLIVAPVEACLKPLSCVYSSGNNEKIHLLKSYSLVNFGDTDYPMEPIGLSFAQFSFSKAGWLAPGVHHSQTIIVRENGIKKKKRIIAAPMAPGNDHIEWNKELLSQGRQIKIVGLYLVPGNLFRLKYFVTHRCEVITSYEVHPNQGLRYYEEKSFVDVSDELYLKTTCPYVEDSEAALVLDEVTNKVIGLVHGKDARGYLDLESGEKMRNMTFVTSIHTIADEVAIEMDRIRNLYGETEKKYLAYEYGRYDYASEVWAMRETSGQTKWYDGDRWPLLQAITAWSAQSDVRE